MEYQLSYKKVKGKKFPWLFVDPDTLTDYAEKSGYRVINRITGEHFDYLVELGLE
jgi:hypothetical protein